MPLNRRLPEGQIVAIITTVVVKKRAAQVKSKSSLLRRPFVEREVFRLARLMKRAYQSCAQSCLLSLRRPDDPLLRHF